ncbi:hypothetical protein STVA_11120 [Allostella vacuolata]|nr:hypothetical protein STVA_11120 [Stella vacuolata]
MGLNVRTGDRKTPLAERVTAEREARDNAARDRVRRGEITLDDYLRKFKGFSGEQIVSLRPAFARAIWGEEGARRLGTG